MSYLIAVICRDEGGANALRAELVRAHPPPFVGLNDAAIVVRRRDGTIEVEQAADLVGTGTVGGAFWGMLAGLIFFMPSLGLAVGALVGTRDGHFTDIGVDDYFLKEVGRQTKASKSALLLLLAEDTRDWLFAQVASSDATIIQTCLSAAQEERLTAAFGV